MAINRTIIFYGEGPSPGAEREGAECVIKYQAVEMSNWLKHRENLLLISSRVNTCTIC